MRCLVYSSNRLFGQCLASGLSGSPGIECALSCGEAACIAAEARALDATSVLIDFACDEGRAAIPRLSRSLPGICLLGLSVDDRCATNVVACARLGCHAIVPQDAGIEDVVRILAEAEAGEVRIRPAVAATMMRALAAPAEEVSRPAEVPACLTRREREICELVCEGLTNKEIALEVNRSVATVKNHVHTILTKLDLPRRGAIPGRLMGPVTPSTFTERRNST